MALKTKRYSGKEKDATGLYYYGARYFDPIGPVDGLNLYRFVRNNPINAVDKNGNKTYIVSPHNDVGNFVTNALGISEAKEKAIWPLFKDAQQKEKFIKHAEDEIKARVSKLSSKVIKNSGECC